MDMLQGSRFKKLLLFALPLAASSILQQLFNSIDVAVVGKFASSQAQAAVGCNGPVINLFVGISVRANVVIAQYVGQKMNHKIAIYFKTGSRRICVGSFETHFNI